MRLPAGQSFQLILQENRSTGYMWFVSNNSCDKRVQLRDDKYMSHPENSNWVKRYGWTGERIIDYEAPEGGLNTETSDCQIEYIYRRPWAEYQAGTVATDARNRKIIDITVVS